MKHRRKPSSAVRPIEDPDYTIYRLVTEDFQCVAMEKLGRKLTGEELQLLQSEFWFEWCDEVAAFIDVYIRDRDKT